MPRTFSRGKKIDSETIFQLFEHLDLDEEEIFISAARIKWCTEPALEEQEIIDPLLDLLKRFSAINNHIIEFHPSLITDTFRTTTQFLEVITDLTLFIQIVQLKFGPLGEV